METVIYSHNQGEGIILDEEYELEVEPHTVTLGGSTIKPGDMTTLDGYFGDDPIEYKGAYDIRPNDEGNVFASLVFYLGSDSNLFEIKHYYKVLHYLTPERFYVNFAYGSGRDFNWKEGKWK